MGKVYAYRFELFFFSQLAILFGSLIVPDQFFENILMPILFLINIASGIILISKQKPIYWFFISLFILAFVFFGIEMIKATESDTYLLLRFGIYFLFYSVVVISIIKQVWNAERVTKNVIIGLMSGYVSLGLVAFLLFASIEFSNPDSFEGVLLEANTLTDKVDTLLYYSYITLLTIGYGEIIPVTPLAQKAAILTGLIGQFYIVIITAVVVEKYIGHSKND